MSTDVLIVDDAATVRMYHGGILRDAGFAVVEAGNGYEALELVLARRFALVVSDVNMPKMDGYAFVSALRRGAGPSSSTPVVMVSTESADADADHAYAAGANIYLTKPVTASDLVSVALTLTGTSRS